MLKQLLNSFSVMLLLALSGCSSPLVAESAINDHYHSLDDATAPDLLTPLNGIISPSERELKSVINR